MESMLFSLFVRRSCLFFTVLTVPFNSLSVDVVLTTRGPIGGSIEIERDGFVYASFRGVPYAKPPIGELRFRNPRRLDEWTDTSWAIIPRPPCLARDPTSGITDGTEDCLYLDIYTGQSSEDVALQDNHWPVLVIFAGIPRLRVQSRSWLLRHVIVVVAHHRLQVLGFLSRDDESRPPGLMDQAMALQWVHENIIAFGGDPDNVTIVGEGESGSRVAALIRFPSARGLFTRVGIFSAPLGITTGTRDATHALASRVACPRETRGDVVSCFSRVDASALVEKQRGNEFVPSTNFDESPSSHVPCVIGMTSRDGVSFLEETSVEFQLRRVLRNADYARTAVKEFYGSRYTGTDSQIVLDAVFYAPALRFAKEHARYANTYLYELTFEAPGMMRLLFGDPVSAGDVDERVVMDEASILWTNFVKTGDPSATRSDIASWVRVTSDPSCYEINVEPRMTFPCRRHFQASFWNSLKTIDYSSQSSPNASNSAKSCSCVGLILTSTVLVIWTLSLLVSSVYLLLQVYIPRWKSSLVTRFPRLGRWITSNA